MAIIFDSNVWIGLFNENDGYHQKAKQLFFESPVIYIPEYVVLEITTVLQLRATKQKSNEFAQMITATAGLEIIYAADDFFRATLRIFQQQTQKLSFVDGALLELAKKYTVHIFDEALAQAIVEAQ
jgi:predicted nucleic acid-binding protein